MQIGTRSLHADYDEESDTLYLYSKKEKAAYSIHFGNIMLDMARNGEVIGLEFLNAIKTITPLLFAVPKVLLGRNGLIRSDMLNDINKASVSLHTEADFVVLSFILVFDKEKVEGRLGVPVPTPDDREAAKAFVKA